MSILLNFFYRVNTMPIKISAGFFPLDKLSLKCIEKSDSRSPATLFFFFKVIFSLFQVVCISLCILDLVCLREKNLLKKKNNVAGLLESDFKTLNNYNPNTVVLTKRSTNRSTKQSRKLKNDLHTFEERFLSTKAIQGKQDRLL